MMRNRLARYAPWMVRDYFLWGGVATFGIVFGFGWLFWRGMSVPIRLGNDPEQATRMIRGLASTLAVMLATLGPLIGTLSIVSIDRMQGYYRFLFSRPVSPPAYYATKFSINGAGFLVVAAALWGTFSVAIASFAAPRFLPVMVLSYVFIGGVVYLISVLTRMDLLVSVLVYFVSAIMWGTLDRDPPPTGWLETARPILSLLPPVHKHAAFVNGILRPEFVMSWKSVLWVAGYGVACFAAGTLILRRRNLAG